MVAGRLKNVNKAEVLCSDISIGASAFCILLKCDWPERALYMPGKTLSYGVPVLALEGPVLLRQGPYWSCTGLGRPCVGLVDTCVGLTGPCISPAEKALCLC